MAPNHALQRSHGHMNPEKARQNLASAAPDPRHGSSTPPTHPLAAAASPAPRVLCSPCAAERGVVRRRRPAQRRGCVRRRVITLCFLGAMVCVTPYVSLAETPTISNDCPHVSFWLKDPAKVGHLRGIDIPELNFRITCCRDVVPTISNEERAILVRALESLARPNPKNFAARARSSLFRLQVATRLNAQLQRQAVLDWSVDFWEVAY